MNNTCVDFNIYILCKYVCTSVWEVPNVCTHAYVMQLHFKLVRNYDIISNEVVIKLVLGNNLVVV